MSTNHYEFSDAMLPKDERPHYCHIVAESDTARLDFYVNRNLEGLWVRDERTGDYKQIRGTMQYRLPSSADGIRKKLRKELEQLEGEDF